ncbi:MAG: hypothetical protein RI996_41 [Candidatus Parcubacteria bacterium]|jgi:predicted lactoylglutathione lyase
MSKQVYINLIVKDLSKATTFYEAIGCTKNPEWSNDTASAMVLNESIFFMLLTEEFAKNFNDGKEFVDQKKTVSAFYALSCESKQEVDIFCAAATQAGGRVYENTFNKEVAGDFMYSFEVEDLDGYILEPFCMDMSTFKQN